MRNFLTQDEAARLFRVSRRPVTATAKVLGRESRAIPELRRAVLSGRITVSDAAAAVREPAGVQRAAVDLALRRETRTVKQAVNIVKEELGLPEDIESAATIPDAAANVPPVFHQSAVAGLHGLVEPETVDAIVTFPPANAWSGPLLTDLAGFAAHSLKRTGGMFVLAGTESLPEFIGRLRHTDLSWVCALHCVHHDRTAGSRRNPRGGAPGQKLLLVYGKPGFRRNGGDGVISALPHDEGTQGNRRSHLYAGMELIISRFTAPGAWYATHCSWEGKIPLWLPQNRDAASSAPTMFHQDSNTSSGNWSRREGRLPVRGNLMRWFQNRRLPISWKHETNHIPRQFDLSLMGNPELCRIRRSQQQARLSGLAGRVQRRPARPALRLLPADVAPLPSRRQERRSGS